jgi:hypothetical protein
MGSADAGHAPGLSRAAAQGIIQLRKTIARKHRPNRRQWQTGD